MDVRTIVSEVGSWPVEERIRLIDEIWAGLHDEGHVPVLTDEQKMELDRRLAEDDAAPEDAVSWDEVKAAALRRAGK
jgi:putative addiction module component (TIGR02574 family)